MKNDNRAKIIGKKIKSVRVSKGLTQIKLAEICDASANHISSIETGSSNGSFSLLISICNALEITPDFLFKDFLSTNTVNISNDIELIDSDTLSKYLKLKPKSRNIVDNMIIEMYNIQKSK